LSSWWQLAQDSVLFADSRGSLNNWRPSATRSRLTGAISGKGLSGWFNGSLAALTQTPLNMKTSA
jgi:hypothetical protein